MAVWRLRGLLDPASFSYRWTHPDPRMDRLQQEASRLVEVASSADEDPGVTFYRLRDLACGTLGRSAPGRPVLAAERSRPPRLTEPWFC